MEILLIGFLSYISGSIPFGLILTKLFSGKDVRKIGSGNIGATNVLRTGNKYLALLTLFFDITKGYIPVLIVREHFTELVSLSCILIFLGHVFPIWLKFKGGKGVATYLGIITALSIQMSFLFIVTWIIIYLIFKYSSLSSMFATATVFVVNFLRETIIIADVSLSAEISVPNSTILFTFLILIIYTHRKNISNLKNNKESKIKL